MEHSLIKRYSTANYTYFERYFLVGSIQLLMDANNSEAKDSAITADSLDIRTFMYNILQQVWLIFQAHHPES